MGESSKLSTHQCGAIDIRKVREQLLLDEHTLLKPRGIYVAIACTKKDSNLDGNGNPKSIKLIYGYKGERIEQTISLEWTPCNYGGFRVWLLCPKCAKRVSVIYGAGKYFACRHCYDLCYQSQKETPSDRAFRRAFKIRHKVGDKQRGIVHLFPDKPKGMHWKTYWRLYLEGQKAEREAWGFVSAWLDRQNV